MTEAHQAEGAKDDVINMGFEKFHDGYAPVIEKPALYAGHKGV